MTDVKRCRILVLAFLCLYFLAGVYSRLTAINQENLYLTHSWSLYSKIPPVSQTEYVLLVHKVGANTYDPPVFAHKLQGIVFSTLTDYYHLLTDEVRELADAVATADEEKISTARAKVEHNFIQRPVVYDLAVITYEPVSFWKTGKPTSQTILASFEMDEHE